MPASTASRLTICGRSYFSGSSACGALGLRGAAEPSSESGALALLADRVDGPGSPARETESGELPCTIFDISAHRGKCRFAAEVIPSPCDSLRSAVFALGCATMSCEGIGVEVGETSIGVNAYRCTWAMCIPYNPMAKNAPTRYPVGLTGYGLDDSPV